MVTRLRRTVLGDRPARRPRILVHGPGRSRSGRSPSSVALWADVRRGPAGRHGVVPRRRRPPPRPTPHPGHPVSTGACHSKRSPPCLDISHRSPRMTLVYARISDTTVAEQYFTATRAVEADATTTQTAAGGSDHPVARLHRRLLGNGHCTRPLELDCRFQTICEGCGFSRPARSSSPSCAANATTPPPTPTTSELRSTTTSSASSTQNSAAPTPVIVAGAHIESRRPPSSTGPRNQAPRSPESRETRLAGISGTPIPSSTEVISTAPDPSTFPARRASMATAQPPADHPCNSASRTRSAPCSRAIADACYRTSAAGATRCPITALLRRGASVKVEVLGCAVAGALLVILDRHFQHAPEFVELSVRRSAVLSGRAGDIVIVVLDVPHQRRWAATPPTTGSLSCAPPVPSPTAPTSRPWSLRSSPRVRP